MKTPEGKVKDKVKALLKQYGAYQFWPVQMGYGARTLDCLACHYGRFLVVETKAEGKDLTPFQKNTRAQMQKSSAAVLRVSNDIELEILEDWLKQTAVFYKHTATQAAELDKIARDNMQQVYD